MAATEQDTARANVLNTPDASRRPRAKKSADAKYVGHPTRAAAMPPAGIATNKSRVDVYFPDTETPQHYLSACLHKSWSDHRIPIL